SLLERAVKVDRGFSGQIQAALDGLADDVERDTDFFSHQEVKFGRQFAAKLRHGIGPAMHRLHRQVAAGDEMLRLLNPRMVLTPFGRRSMHALGDLSSSRGIPGLLVSHASFTPTKGDLEEIAWGFHGDGLFHGSYTHAALQTPLAEEYSQQVSSQARFVPMGPVVWGHKADRSAAPELRAKMLPSREDSDEDWRVVVHAGTPHGRMSIHFHVYETMDEYIGALRDLVLAVDQLPDVFLIIKAKATPLSPDELRALLPPSERYCISVEERFLDVLGFSDLLVSFASTTIEEALQNQVPVLLYGGQGRYQHVQAFEVTPGQEIEPKAVYSVRNAENLSDALKRVLDTCGKAPLPQELFERYVYRPDQITQFPDLVRSLVGN
ncbi:hypothetical protein M1N45_04525, partial [Dehalococcoidia bacterium]|nr:hypothetical protein [Dehalococcoidia bacterium]